MRLQRRGAENADNDGSRIGERSGPRFAPLFSLSRNNAVTGGTAEE